MTIGETLVASGDTVGIVLATSSNIQRDEQTGSVFKRRRYQIGRGLNQN